MDQSEADTVPVRRRLSWFFPLLVLVMGGISLPIAYEKSCLAATQARHWLTMRSVEWDLDGKEMVLDLKSQRKTSADKMSKDDVLKAFWVSELRRSQLESEFDTIRQVVQWEPYMNRENETGIEK